MALYGVTATTLAFSIYTYALLRWRDGGWADINRSRRGQPTHKAQTIPWSERPFATRTQFYGAPILALVGIASGAVATVIVVTS